jgi:stage II sporulation protein D
MNGADWKVVLNKPSADEAEEAMEKLEDLGFEATLSESKEAKTSSPVIESKASNTSSGKLKLTARPGSSTREVVAFSRGAAPMLRSSAPLLFASSDEKNAPVRFNDKPYRGKIEVFANNRGSVTVVNVIGLEDYIRGVVPNELSYPALEALKAQAIAARTYALKNRGQFASEGYDLLPTTRSQVYRGLTSETELTSRAVEETRGIIATYEGEPINALYTSTCGGRTEEVGNIFNEALPYLRARECAVEGKAAFDPFTLRSSRELFEIKDERDLSVVRDVALLAVNGFDVRENKVSSSWLTGHVSESEALEWLGAVSRLTRNPAPSDAKELDKPPQFCSALVRAIYGEDRADTLLNKADVDYLLSFRDGEQVPQADRAAVAMLIRSGALSLYPDATLRPKDDMSRATALRAIARVLDGRNLLSLQKGTARPAAGGVMVLKSNKGRDVPVQVNSAAYLFREYGDNLYQVKSVALVGGEPVVFHTNTRGEVDYLEVRPANNGAAADRYSSLSNWTVELSLGAVQSRLGRSVRGIGSITDLRIAKRGPSRRVIDLEVIGTQGVGHIRGGRIRSALGLKEQLFVIDRVYNDSDRVAGFVITGRGWGHGVGMCQFGAYGLAKQGLNVTQILKTYYAGIELTKAY